MDPKKQLSIKAKSCKRLSNDLKSYVKEKKDHDQKLTALNEAKAAIHEIKRQQEFVTETESALEDTKLRVKQAFADLIAFVDKVKEELKESKELDEALAVIKETASFIEEKKKIQTKRNRRRKLSSSDLAHVKKAMMCGKQLSHWDKILPKEDFILSQAVMQERWKLSVMRQQKQKALSLK